MTYLTAAFPCGQKVSRFEPFRTRNGLGGVGDDGLFTSVEGGQRGTRRRGTPNRPASQGSGEKDDQARYASQARAGPLAVAAPGRSGPAAPPSRRPGGPC